MTHTLSIDSDFAGGNILVERIDGDTVSLHQDLRDTAGDWFYWAFRLRGAAGRRLTFRFTGSDVLGARGPAMSSDRGQTWQWLGEACVTRSAAGQQGVSFSHAFPADADDVLLAFCPLYTQRNLDEFLSRRGRTAGLHKGVLCPSRDGRDVELLTSENLLAPVRLLLTARHHACEAMASYCMEGILGALLASDETGTWLRQHVSLAAVPFIDKAGVEAGDQGKNRKPYDHNRDYGGEVNDSIYPEVRALREWAPAWLAQAERAIVIDLHCPWIRGGRNEEAFFVGMAEPTIWQRVHTGFSPVFERTSAASPIRFDARNNLPFGQEWNTLTGNAIGGGTCSKWACALPRIHFAVSMEVPYANAGGAEVTPDSARTLGRDLAAALREYLRAGR